MEIVAHQHAGSLAAIEAAIASPADRIELDVLLHDGRLVVAHGPRDARDPAAVMLDQALDLLARSVKRLLADVKTAATARPLAQALLDARLAERTVATGRIDHINAVAELCGAARAWTLPAPGAAAGPLGLSTRQARHRIAQAASKAIADGRCEAVSVERHFVDEALCDAVHRAGGRVFAWTVNRSREIRRLAALPVDGVVTDDPTGAQRALRRQVEDPAADSAAHSAADSAADRAADRAADQAADQSADEGGGQAPPDDTRAADANV